MSTKYPTSLPTVDLPDRWNHEVLRGGDGFIDTRVTATNEAEAECRSLAVLDYDYEDDLSDAVATAIAHFGTTWVVRIKVRRDG